MKRFTVQAGSTHTLGARTTPDGVNFALAAPNADRVELCLFSADGQHEIQRLELKGREHGIWHGLVRGAMPGLVYGYRVHGRWDPPQGHRFNPAKLLLDPCAREVLGGYDGNDVHLGHQLHDPSQPDLRDNAALALKARVVAELPPVTARVRGDAAARIIYEMHIKGFTALHPQVPAPLRGTYAGVAHPAAIAHLQTLGVTTVCLMPLAFRADEARLQRAGLSNYWGYSPIAWNAPERRYWSGAPGSSPRSELRAMVDALHAAGLEVVLDVVYNHTAETDALGPTLSLRGIDNATYYQLDPAQPGAYMNWTGCGNCVNLNHPLVLRTVMDSLRGWVAEFGVDGFRFDLATVLARGDASTQFAYAARAPFLMALAQDPVLREVLVIAEPWDIGPGGYRLGQFPAQWLEWNDQFRDVQRGFWLHQQVSLGVLAQRLAGSSDCFDTRQRAPHCSVNFVTAHDGFTLTDLVSYTQRHNHANGEHNRDGHAHNLSVNHGVEGPTTRPEILAARRVQQRTLLAVTLLALGTPMLLSGDEMGHSQHGNNNAYCQDNATTWLNWKQADHALLGFVARLTALRRQRRVLQGTHWWQAPGGASPRVAQWFTPAGVPMADADWHAESPPALVLLLRDARGAREEGEEGEECAASEALESVEAVEVVEVGQGDSVKTPGDAAWSDCVLLFNASSAALAFRLPAGPWVCHVDTACEVPGAQSVGGGVDAPVHASVVVAPGCLWLASRSPLRGVRVDAPSGMT